MSDYRQECIRRKDVQIGKVDARPVGTKKKAGAKPYLLESFFLGRWGWAGRYVDAKTANRALEQQSRKHPRWGWRLIFGGKVIHETAPIPPEIPNGR